MLGRGPDPDPVHRHFSALEFPSCLLVSDSVNTSEEVAVDRWAASHDQYAFLYTLEADNKVGCIVPLVEEADMYSASAHYLVDPLGPASAWLLTGALEYADKACFSSLHPRPPFLKGWRLTKEGLLLKANLWPVLPAVHHPTFA